MKTEGFHESIFVKRDGAGSQSERSSNLFHGSPFCQELEYFSLPGS